MLKFHAESDEQNLMKNRKTMNRGKLMILIMYCQNQSEHAAYIKVL